MYFETDHLIALIFGNVLAIDGAEMHDIECLIFLHKRTVTCKGAFLYEVKQNSVKLNQVNSE